jgi:hypothetical protein
MVFDKHIALCPRLMQNMTLLAQAEQSRSLQNDPLNAAARGALQVQRLNAGYGKVLRFLLEQEAWDAGKEGKPLGLFLTTDFLQLSAPDLSRNPLEFSTFATKPRKSRCQS